ncbi:methyltransferase domain-containing protein [Streptomyces sp. H34-S4]|uniref:methyltransferase domain-containing protein n=1 Tax=Streptomyces sp. H34-S4 TaxID=2996463 RepID=UPI002270AF51|nr:methyltransferase domain-containing protein [Streptomyces sp. H34-S4]MCY0937552.1 methyltransferase domain-containing protein [Streptomyces sp. H34-S4]
MSTSGPGPAGATEYWDSGSYAEAIHARRGDLSLRAEGGRHFPLGVERWCGRADTVDQGVLRRCRGQVLDIGCGAGRLVEALTGQSHTVLGIDVRPAAVITTVCRGGAALSRSVFDPLPDEGLWETALLIDGNIGIGGDPSRLLRRVRDLVHGQGQLLVETAPVDVDDRHHVQIYTGHQPASPGFPWATVGTNALHRLAADSGWTVSEEWTAAAGSRHFVALEARA